MNRPAVADLQRQEAAEHVAIIVDVVAEYFHVPAADIRSRKIADGVAWARQVASYLVNELLGEPVAFVAAKFRQDRTTVMHSLSRVKDMLGGAPRVAADIQRLRELIIGRLPQLEHTRETALQRHRRLTSGKDVPPRIVASAELDGLLRDLRRGLATAIWLDPGAVLAGFKRTVDDVNSKGTPR